ncbi:MAG: tetratricopeptide repeat protein [Novosphingobium sp.]|jgi:cytochrome c-type biogenesis protein CcmH|nr:tetratricopeptide repeat protein [Novosphingobium sp.]
MAQETKKALPIGRIALILGAFAAAFAVVYAVSRNRDGAPPVAVASADADPQSLAALEQRAQGSPTDAKAWQELGFAYFQQGRFDDAARAYDKATGIDPKQALLWSALGEARVMASEKDPMPPAALSAFERALALDAKDPRARYFLAVKRDLGGDHAGALADWLALLADTPADAPWRTDLVRTIEQVGKINQVDVAPKIAAAQKAAPPPTAPMAARAIPGPSAQDLAAAGAIPPSQQRDMAEGMVARLEARLKSQPQNVEGWVMLMRSRATLGQPDKAAAALRDAVAANPARAAELREQAQVLGVR